MFTQLLNGEELDMGLIAQSRMTILNSALEVKQVAASAALIQEEMSVAHLINEAANCGEYSVVCNRQLSDELTAKLDEFGYTLQYTFAKAKETDEVIISWE